MLSKVKIHTNSQMDVSDMRQMQRMQEKLKKKGGQIDPSDLSDEDFKFNIRQQIKMVKNDSAGFRRMMAQQNPEGMFVFFFLLVELYTRIKLLSFKAAKQMESISDEMLLAQLESTLNMSAKDVQEMSKMSKQAAAAGGNFPCAKFTLFIL